MRNLNLKLLIILILATIIGCSTNKKTEDEYLNAAKAKFDNKQYEEAIVEYREFLKNYPKSDKGVFVLNQIAGIYIDPLKNPQEGVKTYKELAEKYPNTKEAKQSLFMVAFIYDETLKDKDNAIKSYQEFLAKYPSDSDPNDKMSESARTMLEVLQSGKSIEEIIQQNIDKMSAQSKTDSINIKKDTTNKEMNKKDPRVPPVKKDKTNAPDSETPSKDKQ